MKRAGVLFLLAAMLPPAARGAGLGAEGVVYYDRGHYWIEIAFRDGAGRDTLPPGLEAACFEIRKAGREDAGFRPSRIEILADEAGRPFVLLCSARIEGGCCYRVTAKLPAGGTATADGVCDPFAARANREMCGARAFFQRHIAAAFRREGESYRLNRLSYGYDFSTARSSASLAIEPRFKIGGWSLEPGFEQHTVSYSLRTSGRTATERRSLAAGLSGSSWSHGLRFTLSGRYADDRWAFELAAGDDSVLSTRSLAVEGRIGFDNLFDRVNRSCTSVWKGVEIGFGYVWHARAGAGSRGGHGFESIRPCAGLRATWTFLYGFQISYAVQSYWPTSAGDTFAEFHSVRCRLLLRDALASLAGRAYHPDVELAWDTGSRPPLFGREERLSIGFALGLYPW